KFELAFSNAGIAPIYYDWPTRIYLFDENGDILTTYSLEMDLRKVLPGELHQVEFLVPVDKLENGTYKIGIAIIDPITAQPAVKLAMQNIRQDMIQEIGSFEVDWAIDALTNTAASIFQGK
ncbi:MAG: DUF4832 domain-containing protein, partial [Chloroflexota bacterium]|nr:DUF4832 domain-containing protein [Chloroflexota bacterium]